MKRTSRRGPKVAILSTALEAGLAAALVAALGIFHVWSRTRVVSAGYALAELQGEHVRLVAAHDRLTIELGMLTSFGALSDAARTKLSKLGLAPPDRGAVWAAGPGQDALGRAGVDGIGIRSPRPVGPITPGGLGETQPPQNPGLAPGQALPPGPALASLRER